MISQIPEVNFIIHFCQESQYMTSTDVLISLVEINESKFAHICN
jgi:hypothetical protein